ncbi:TPA: AI-2E family transporter [Neisseria meningitidis]|uniref:AI-2E family transporter n=1 Tax=Neisseria meningitidis TaxID=487 RepID=UPI00025E214B|nr:AI-2E family transporter [Neisseria meningitidis]ANW89522.1 putative membrane protein [Neisseria meningitidis]EHP15196.1 putative membrane protein [Neisseria meningitidis NM220]EOC58155.1 hypothetical protein NM271_1146 [Neisseria meningitidis NM271]EOC60129.1 hypothetical protein NM90_1197 [Neisseria meningitidis NM90]EOC64308.1 hypothetical protein NM3042_1154 [Neisseria meningitidis NM3042]
MYRRKGRGIKPWMGAGAAFAALVWLAFALGDTLAPFAVAAVLAYVLDPLVEWLQKKGLNRASASMSVMVFSLILLLALLLIIVPMLVGQFNNLASRLPQLIGFMQNTLLPWLKNTIGGYVEIDQASIIAWLQAHTGELSNTLKAWFPVLMRQGSNIVSSIGNLLLLPLLLYYFLLDWQRWSCGIAKLVPRRFAGAYTRITGNLNEVLGEFLRGQLLVMLIMGLVYGLGLVLVGLDSGFAIGMVAGILVFVPYLGAFTGLLLATVAALLQFGSWNGILSVWAVFAVGQFLESFFITPKIVGDRIGLSPFWVIFSLMAFGQLMGFVGMLAGLPLAAVTLVLLREGVQKYFAGSFYRGR